MTLRELIQLSDGRSVPLAAALVVVPLAAWLVGRCHAPGRGGTAPWKYVYAVLVYAACVPGTFAATLTGYALFFRNEDLLDVNLLVYFGPVVAMVVALVLIRRRVPFDDVPGFDRLSGLMTTIACSFALALAIQKTRLWVVFGGRVEMLFAVAAAAFALLKWGAWMFLRPRGEPARKRPSFPDLGSKG